MDGDHLLAAFRYIALNPVKAGLTAEASDWPWSSARAHIAGCDTPYVDVAPALARIDDFAAFVAAEPTDAGRWSVLLKAEQVGRRVGAKAWIEALEEQHGRRYLSAKRGLKPRSGASTDQSGDLFCN
jgi:putative transposase